MSRCRKIVVIAAAAAVLVPVVVLARWLPMARAASEARVFADAKTTTEAFLSQSGGGNPAWKRLGPLQSLTRKVPPGPMYLGWDDGRIEDSYIGTFRNGTAQVQIVIWQPGPLAVCGAEINPTDEWIAQNPEAAARLASAPYTPEGYSTMPMIIVKVSHPAFRTR